MGLILEGYGRLKETIGMYHTAGPKELSFQDASSLQWLEKETGQISLGRNSLTSTFSFQTRSGAGWKRVLRSLCHSRTRVPLLAAVYFLMVHVLLVLCLTGHL